MKKKEKEKKKKGIGDDQKEFIEGKIRELGSKEAVAEFYSKDDLVSEYAKKMAKKFKLPEKADLAIPNE